MSSIVEQIEKEIASLTTAADKKNVGSITSLADGVAKVDGLSSAMYMEMIEFPGGLTGLALNLEENAVGCVIMGDTAGVREGDEVKATGKLLSVPVGMGLLGRVVDALGALSTGRAPSPQTNLIQSSELLPELSRASQ